MRSILLIWGSENNCFYRMRQVLRIYSISLSQSSIYFVSLLCYIINQFIEISRHFHCLHKTFSNKCFIILSTIMHFPISSTLEVFCFVFLYVSLSLLLPPPPVFPSPFLVLGLIYPNISGYS